MNLFGFCRNSPMNEVDFDGRAATAAYVGGGIIVVVGGGCLYAACRLHMRELRLQADQTALQLMAQLDPSFDPEEGHPNDQPGNSADALRHCIGACMANQHPGPCLLRTLVRRRIQAREAGGLPMDRSDYMNNAIGFGVTGDCVKGCLTALKRRTLQCLSPGGEAVPCTPPPGLAITE